MSDRVLRSFEQISVFFSEFAVRTSPAACGDSPSSGTGMLHQLKNGRGCHRRWNGAAGKFGDRTYCHGTTAACRSSHSADSALNKTRSPARIDF
jgi:hypothetical protein